MDAALFEFLFNTFLFIGLIVVLKDRKNVKRLLIEITKLNDLVNLQKLKPVNTGVNGSETET